MGRVTSFWTRWEVPVLALHPPWALGHLSDQDLHSPVHMCVLFRSIYLLRPHSALRVYDLTSGHLGPFLLGIVTPTLGPRAWWVENRLEFGLHSSLTGHLSFIQDLHSCTWQLLDFSSGQSRENQGRPPLGFLSHHHWKRIPCIGKAGEIFFFFFWSRYLKSGSTGKNYFNRKKHGNCILWLTENSDSSPLISFSSKWLKNYRFWHSLENPALYIYCLTYSLPRDGVPFPKRVEMVCVYYHQAELSISLSMWTGAWVDVYCSAHPEAQHAWLTRGSFLYFYAVRLYGETLWSFAVL